MGTYSVIFEKQVPEIWPYLFGNREIVPQWEELMEENKTLKDEFNKKLKEAEAARVASMTKSDL